MERKTVIWIVVIAVVLLGCILLACLSGFAWLNWKGGGWREQMPMMQGSLGDYASNGEQIYFTATSQRGTTISYDEGAGMMGRGRGMMMGSVACASCHGEDGRGGTVRMMRQSIEVPDIRYRTLTEQGHGDEHELFTDEDIRRAITEGVEPNGEELEWPMPRWQMSDADLDDLIAFLKTLE